MPCLVGLLAWRSIERLIARMEWPPGTLFQHSRQQLRPSRMQVSTVVATVWATSVATLVHDDYSSRRFARGTHPSAKTAFGFGLFHAVFGASSFPLRDSRRISPACLAHARQVAIDTLPAVRSPIHSASTQRVVRPRACPVKQTRVLEPTLMPKNKLPSQTRMLNRKKKQA